MILADTNVFIDYWNAPSENLTNISLLLSAFDELPFETSDWQTLGRNLYQLRNHGLTLPISDAIIATLAIKNHIPVWTNDQHFAMIQHILPDLRLYPSAS